MREALDDGILVSGMSTVSGSEFVREVEYDLAFAGEGRNYSCPRSCYAFLMPEFSQEDLYFDASGTISSTSQRDLAG
jgi:hypothetical protein